jgi:hypothetical protein
MLCMYIFSPLFVLDLTVIGLPFYVVTASGCGDSPIHFCIVNAVKFVAAASMVFFPAAPTVKVAGKSYEINAAKALY